MIIADTGFFIALFNARDDHHPTAKALLYKLTEPLITTHAVIHETYYLLGARGGSIRQQSEFLIDIAESAFQVFTLETHHFRHLSHLLPRDGSGSTLGEPAISPHATRHPRH